MTTPRPSGSRSRPATTWATWGSVGVLGLVCALPATSSAHDQRPPGRPIRELFAPPSWAGQWQFRFEQRSLATGNLIATEETTQAICPGDRLGLSAYVGRRAGHDHHDADDAAGADGLRVACTGSATDDGLEVACASRFTHQGCRVDFQSSLGAVRQADALAGTGEWRLVDATGDCEALLQGASLGETFQVAAVRLGSDLSACLAPPASLIEKLFSQPELVRLLPPPIADLAARRHRHAVLLTWTAAPRAAAYNVYRAPQDEPFRLIARRPAHRARFKDHRVRPQQTYRYVVRWLDAEGRESPVSNEAAAGPSDGER